MSNEDKYKIVLLDDIDKEKEKENDEEEDEDDIKILVTSQNNIDNKDDDLEEEKKEEKKINNDENKINVEETPVPTNNNTLDKNYQDKLLLVDMGFEKLLVDRIYRTVYPTNIEEALDYLQKDENDKFTHSYVPNTLNVCSICGKLRTAHAGEALLIQRERETERARERERQRNSFKNTYNTYNKNNYSYGKKECGVCSDEIPSNDLSKVKLPCKHYFCLDCWLEYLKEKINNANVYKLSCMDHKCGFILEEKFIKSIIGSDETLLEKYNKFLTRKKLMDSNKKIKFCPIPDCDGYAEKKKNKYVTCNFGHEFCFQCGQKPHGKKKMCKSNR